VDTELFLFCDHAWLGGALRSPGTRRVVAVALLYCLISLAACRRRLHVKNDGPRLLCCEVNTIWCLLLIDRFALPPRSIYAQWAIAAGLFITGVVLFTIAFGETMRVLTGTYRRPSTDNDTLEFCV
jgi:hypothetical protein